MALGTNTGGGTLSGTLSAVTGASGIAVFTTLSINQIGNYTLVASAPNFPSATSLAFAVTASINSGLAVFNNKIAFLTATGAANATGPLPGLGSVNSGATVGGVTFTPAPGGDTLDIGGAIDWYPGLPGNEIALGFENLQVSFASPVTAMGFVFVEPAATMPPHGGTPVDSPYLVTLFNGAVEVGSFQFNAPNDQIAFVGVSSVTPFTRATIVDTTGNDDDEYFGEFYTASGGGVAYVVTNTNDSGAGSLRQAITAANATASADSVIFNIPGENRRINLTSALPAIGAPINIDGTTQPGFAGVPIIEIDGTLAGAGVAGLNIAAGSSTVRGLMINVFSQNGIAVSSGNNTIIGNWIGIGNDGVTARPNAANGVHVVDAPGNTIGGITPLAANVVSGNAGEGVRIDGTLATGNIVTGNFIGTTAAGGANPLGNSGNAASGVFIRRAPGNSVIGNTVRFNRGFAGVALCGNQGGFCGGNDVGSQDNNGNGNAVHGNVISNNSGRGLTLDGVANTLVGTGGWNNISGNGNPNNQNSGVLIFGAGATGNQLASNAINSNAGDGVEIVGAGNTGNRVQGNSFTGNANLAIDLDGNGVTANDPLDADGGPNNLQNFPVITDAGPTTVAGTLRSAPSTTFSVQLYESIAPCGASGQGETLKATFNVTTDQNGDGPFLQSGLALTLGRYVTATATDPSGNTSEFAPCATVDDAVTVGAANSGNCYPFMCNDSGTNEGPSIHYQQVYSAMAFSGPTQINSLTFFQDVLASFNVGRTTTVLSGNYQVSLSTTTKPVNGLSPVLATNIGADNVVIFNGNLGGTSTNPSFTITTSTPFAYNPAAGNLLLDIVVTNQTVLPNFSGNGYNDADSTGASTTRAYAFVGNAEGLASGPLSLVGLVTRFNQSIVIP